VTVDVGTGDGRAVLARAAVDPCSLVIGVDADATAMAEASRRADRRHLDNALFLVAGVESLGCSPLAGAADLVTVTFPWGSLLRGVLGLDDAALAGLAALPAPAGRLEVLTSVMPADRVAGMVSLTAAHATAVHDAWCQVGLELAAVRPAATDEITASGSSWARRLRSGGHDRPVWWLAGRRRDAAPVDPLPCDRWKATSSSSA
jgi:16S rRNA (adenine(1408)-N(1))-methyltransferase